MQGKHSVWGAYRFIWQKGEKRAKQYGKEKETAHRKEYRLYVPRKATKTSTTELLGHAHFRRSFVAVDFFTVAIRSYRYTIFTPFLRGMVWRYMKL